MPELLRVAGLALAAVVLLQTAGCSAQQRELRYRERGTGYLQQRNYDKARVEFSNALQINPKDAQAHYLAGVVAEKLGEVRESLGHFQAAIQIDPSLFLARAAAARLYLFAGLPANALELTEAGLKLAPEEPHLLTARGAARAQQGDRQAAQRDAEAAARSAPDDEYVVALLSSIYAQQGQIDQAIDIARRGVERSPGSADLRYILVDLLQKAGRTQDAIAQLDRIVALEPTVVAHRFRLAQAYLGERNTKEAEQVLRAAVAAAPEDVSAKLTLVQMLAQSRDRATAEHQLQEYLQAQPGNDALRLAFAGYYAQTAEAAKAEALYRAVVAHAGDKPDGLNARVRLAGLRLTDKDDDEAKSLAGEVLKRNPTQPDALIVLAEIAMRHADPATAVTNLRAVLRDQPANLQVMRALARAHEVNHEDSLAEEALRSALQVNPQDVGTEVQLLQHLSRAGKQDDAVTLASQAVARQPREPQLLEQLFRLQMERKDYAAARITADTLQRSQPKLALGHYLAGLLDEAQGQAAAAHAAYVRGLELQPQLIEPLTAVVRLDVQARHPERALARLDTVIAADPAHVVAKNLKAEILAAQKRYEEAVTVYSEIIVAAPEWWIPYRGVAAAELTLKRPEAAVAALEKGVHATNETSLASELAALDESLGHTDDAIRVCDEFLKKNPASIVAMNNLATMLANYREDKPSLDRASQLAAALAGESDPRVLHTRGWVAFRTGDYAQAVTLLNKSLSTYPDSPLLRYRLGMAQLKTGDSANARNNLEAALQSGQVFLGVEQARSALQGIRSAG